MIEKLRERARGEQGFTLIELLVVILIIGILAAIAIPSFLSQREKANDADAKVGAESARTAMETFATDNDGDYTGADVTALNAVEPTLVNYTLAVTGADANGYTVTVTSDSTNTFSVTRVGGTITHPCSGDGGCGTDNVW